MAAQTVVPAWPSTAHQVTPRDAGPSEQFSSPHKVADDARQRSGLFTDLVTAHWQSIHRIALRLTGNGADADDLVQDAVLEAYRAFSRFQPGTRFDRWVSQIMTHTFIDTMRRRRRHATVSLDEPDMPTPIDPNPQPDELAARREMHESVQQALSTLPGDFRQALLLVDLKGYAYEEAARMMGTPIGTVRSRLHRARIMLRKPLAPWISRPRRRIA